MLRANRRRMIKATGAITASGLVSLSGCLDQFGGGGDVSMRLANVASPDSVQGHFTDGLVDRVENRTDGGITIDVFPSAELGDAAEIVEGVSSGTIDMGMTAYASVAPIALEDIAVFEVPYMYEDAEHARLANDPEAFDLMSDLNGDLIESANMRSLGGLPIGTRRLHVDRAITSPADLEGMTLRVIPVELFEVMARSWGADTEGVAYSELPNALATGSVNGQDNPVENSYASGLHEHSSHLIMTDHLIHTVPLNINEDVWQNLTDDQQTALRESVRTQLEESTNESMQRETDLVDTYVDEGIEIIDQDAGLDFEAFRTSALDGVNENFPEWNTYIDRISNFSP